MTLILRVILLALLCGTDAGAHSDPLGDIHPRLSVAEGRVVLSFQRRQSAEHSSTWRQVFSHDGQEMVPAHRVANFEEHDTPKPTISKVGEAWVLQRPEGKRHLLPISLQHTIDLNLRGSEASATKWSVAFLTTQYSSTDSRALSGKFICCSLQQFAKPVKCTLPGEVARIYDFSRASAPVWAAGRWWLAWVQVSKEKDKPVWRTLLTSLNPETGEAKHQTLPGISHWNTDLSLVVCNGWLAAAWHSSDGNYPEVAKIITAFLKVPQ